jgi:hypothetical protein
VECFFHHGQTLWTSFEPALGTVGGSIVAAGFRTETKNVPGAEGYVGPRREADAIMGIALFEPQSVSRNTQQGIDLAPGIRGLRNRTSSIAPNQVGRTSQRATLRIQAQANSEIRPNHQIAELDVLVDARVEDLAYDEGS